MVRVSVFAALLATMTTTGARAADQPLYQPQPAWVRPVPIPFDMKPSGAAADMLLWTVQDRLQANDDEGFVEQALRINASEGLERAGNIIQVWDPATDTLAIHRARILRGSQVIDLLAGGRKFTVLRRETNLEAAMIDGGLTATLQPEGLRVGDVLDVAYTLSRHEPALAGHSEGGAVVAHAGTVGRLSVSAIWPAGKPFRTWKTDDLPVLAPVARDGWAGIAFDQTAAVSPEPPKGAPSGDQLFGVLQAADFKGWPEVSAVAYPLYAKAATLKSDSPLKAEIARIAAASSDPKARALAALELVESQTRYLYVGLNAGGYTPAQADLTWTRRFGDCKGKTVLLLALLHGLGVEAEPALVNTTGGDGLDRRLPAMGVFDHVMVRAVIGAKTYWLDATRMGDENLDVLQVPNYRWALPLRAAGAELEPLEPINPALPMVDKTLNVDLSAGLDKPAKVHVDLVLRGDGALGADLLLKQASATDQDRVLKRLMTAAWITPGKVAFSYDPMQAVLHATLDGTGQPPFTTSGSGADATRDWDLEDSSEGWSADFNRQTPYHRDAPFAVDYPAYRRATVEVLLPEAGKGFSLYNNGSVDQTVGGVAYVRSVGLTGERAVVVTSQRSLQRQFPASEAAAAQQALLELGSYDVGVRYAPSRQQAEAIPAAAAEPLDPAVAGDAAFAMKDFKAAEVDFTRAIATQPSAKLYYDRGAARAGLGQRSAARADFEEALKRDPGEAYALFGLGRIEMAEGDMAGAATHFGKAVDASPAATQVAFLATVANTYEFAGDYGLALPYWDRAISSTEASQTKAVFLNGRCWTRAQWGRDLPAALSDCDESLRLRPDSPDTLDSRGLVELRMGTFAKSINDYDAALTKRPRSASSLLGRAMAEARAGQKGAADADTAAALKLDPKVEADFARWGLTK